MKNITRANKQYKGIIPPLITPLKKDYSLDAEALEKLLEYLIDSGVDGIFILGSSGETVNVTHSVCTELTEEALRVINNRIPLFCGVIEPSTARVIERIKVMEDIGASIFVVTPTFYLQNTCQEEILRHYEAVCRSTGNGIVAYNIPSMTHSNILPKTVRKIAAFDNVVAYKDSCADFEQIQHDIFNLADTRVSLFNGAEELCAASMLFGAQGCVPGLANFFPRLFIDVYHAGLSGEKEKAIELQKEICHVRTLLFAGRSWMSAMKYLAFRFGFGEGTVSLPVEPLTAMQCKIIDEIIEPYIDSRIRVP